MFPELDAARARAQRREMVTGLVLLALVAALLTAVVILVRSLSAFAAWACAELSPFLPSFLPSPDALAEALGRVFS